MKISEVYMLKDIVLGHHQTFETKEFSKEQQYLSFKNLILERIDLIEGLREKEKKYLADIDTYLASLRKRLGIILMPKEDEQPPSQPSKQSEGGLIPE